MIPFRPFLIVQLYTMYYHQELVDQYGVYYDRNRFRRLYEYQEKEYCLFQYRKLYPTDQPMIKSLGYPLTITEKFYYLKFLYYFYLFFVIRCVAITMFPTYVVNEEWKRILIGTEHFKSASFPIETTFVFWSSITVLFLRYSLTDRLLDYKWMALYRMSDKNPRFVSPANLDLSLQDYERFHKFRAAALLYYFSIMASIPSFGAACIISMTLQAGLLISNPLTYAIWAPTLCIWIFWVCTVIYSNLVAFIVVAKYIQIKQKSIVQALQKCLTQLKLTRADLTLWKRYGILQWRNFLKQNTRYALLQEELQDYNHFWTKYLSYTFLFYILLISFLIYIILFTRTVIYIQITYSIVLSAHIVLLSAIIYFGGQIVKRNIQLTNNVSGMLADFSTSNPPRMLIRQYIKMNNIGAYLKDTPSGFSLLNGYLITYETFQLLITNITIYFILIIKDRLRGKSQS